MEEVQETIDRLQTSLRTSFMIEDKRVALQKLEYIAKEYPQEVGISALQSIQDVLLKDKDDEDIVRTACQILAVLFADHQMGSQLAEMAIKDKSRLFDPLLFNIEHSGHLVQSECLRLLNQLAEMPRIHEKIQEDVLATSSAVLVLSRCLESDHARLVCLELLGRLSVDQPDIQRIIAFSGAAERALEIAMEEGGIIMGTVTARSCFDLVRIVLDGNHGNQEYLIAQSAFQSSLSLFSFDQSELEFQDRLRETSEAAWSMFSSTISLDSPKLSLVQAHLSGLFECAIQHAIVEQSLAASQFLSRLLSHNNALRLRFLKSHMANNHSALYLLVKEAIGSNNTTLIDVFGSLLVSGQRYSDGQLAIASTMAPGAESPGLLIVDRIVECDPHGSTERSLLSLIMAFNLLSFVVYDNPKVKLMLSRYQVADGQTLLEHIVTQLLLLKPTSEHVIISGLSCLILWCDGCDEVVLRIMEDMGGVIQCLLERVLRPPSGLDMVIGGLAAFLLSLFIPLSADLKDVIRARIGSDLFLSRLDQLSESSHLLDSALFKPPFIRTFRSRYPSFPATLGNSPPDPRDEQIRVLKLQIGDSDGSVYQDLLHAVEHLKAENAALLDQVMSGEAERQSILEQLGTLEQQATEKSGSSRVFFNSLKSVLMPEFEDVSRNNVDKKVQNI